MPRRKKTKYSRRKRNAGNYVSRYINQTANYKNYTYGGIALKAYNDAQWLKQQINVEYKAVDTSVSAISPVSSTGQFLLLNGLTKGDDINNRDGRAVRFKSVQMKCKCTMNASASNTVVRLILFVAKSPNQTAPTAGELLVSDAVNSLRNLSGRKDYTILKEWYIQFGSGMRTELFLNYYRKLDIKTIYDNGDAGTVADIINNGIYLYAVSDQATNTPTFVGNVRLRFIDN